jgi:arylsulfatase A-like enzyme
MPSKPNVVLVITDHANAEATRSNSPCKTPTLDALAASGRRFDRCYTTNAICSPARASMMTGTYPSTHGMWDCTHTQRKTWVDVDDRLGYFSQIFQAAGYATAYHGKWHVEQSHDMARFGWQEACTEGTGGHSACGLPREPLVEGSKLTVRTEGYNDAFIAGQLDIDEPRHCAFDRGIDFITRQQQADSPFLLTVSTIEPHDPYIPPKKYLDMYDVPRTPLPETLHDELGGKPEVLRRMQRVWSELSDDQWRYVRACYWAMMTFIDAEVGRLVDALKRTGQFDNTIIIFTSDHGDMLGGHGLLTKGVATSYEEVYNIPMIVSGPGVKAAGEDASHLVSLVDLAPTMLDICGLDPLETAHGRSFAPILAGQDQPDQWNAAHAEFFGQRYVYTQRITWKDNWKYVFSPGGIDELYDLAADPHETTNRADDPACRDTLHEMCRQMWTTMKTIGDNSLIKTHYCTLRTAPFGPNITDG